MKNDKSEGEKKREDTLGEYLGQLMDMKHHEELLYEDVAKHEAEKKKQWDVSLQKRRGITFEDYCKIDFHNGVIDLYDVGAKVYYIENDCMCCDKIASIRVVISDHQSVIYQFVSGNTVESCRVYTSKEELLESLEKGWAHSLKMGNPYCSSDFQTSADSIAATGYAIRKFDFIHLGVQRKFIYDNKCEKRPISTIILVINEEGVNTSYGFTVPEKGHGQRDTTLYLHENQHFAIDEELQIPLINHE